MKYAFIEEQRTQHCIERMCNLLEVSRAGYYEWRGRPLSERAKADVELRASIVEAHTKSRKVYGRPRIHAQRAAQGVRVGAKRIAVIDALRAALKNRRPHKGTLFHSDRGSQYASDDFREMLSSHGMNASMSGKGECWDNAVVESFFGSMKTELGDPVWESRAIARAAVFDYIEVWYNRERLHSALGYLSPEVFESTLPIAA